MRLVIQLFVFAGMFPTLVFGQIEISGEIIDQQTQSPIAYANIGIAEKGIGTVCDEAGKFSLFLPAENMMDELIISHIGYETKVLLWPSYNDVAKVRIEMVAKINELRGFTFRGKDKMELGYRPQDDRAKGYFKAEGLGMEGGCLIRNTDTVELSTFYMNILELPYDSMKFRLNFYSLTAGKPGSRLNEENINFVLKKNNLGVFSVAIPGRLTVTGDFVCTLELIELFGDAATGVYFTFSAIPDKKGLIFKKGISMGKWETIRRYSLCFWIDGMK